MNKRFSLIVRHVLYTLRGGFLIRPLIIAVCLGLAGAVLSMLDELFPVVSAWVPRFIFPTHADPATAQNILGIIASSMMTVVSIVFAILLMTLTLASMQYSPRILVTFAQDRVTQETLGIFLGTFTYCLAALPAAREVPKPVEPVLTVVGAMILALACVAWLLYFIHHISQAIGVNHIVDRIAGETELIIDETMPRPREWSRVPTTAGLPDPDPRQALVLSKLSGYIRFVDARELVAIAKHYGFTVIVHRRVGHFVPEGAPLMTVSRGDKLTDLRSDELLAAFDLGPTRTLQQDVEFGVLQIVDIALKAISPAVNDPSTAISCIDHLSRVLIRFASRLPQESYYYDPPGTLRVYIPWHDFERLANSAFEQIRLYAKSDVAVSLRLLRALGDVSGSIPDAGERRRLAERGRRIVSGCMDALGEGELGDLVARQAILEGLVEGVAK